jgi:DNA-binding NtrC family response regulator
LRQAVVPPGTLLRVGQATVRVGDGAPASLELCSSEALSGLRGRSAVMRRLMAQVQKLAPSEASVLITGESGTGKELVARALHELSPRAGKPFVTVDCGALSPTLVASELFGHEKGAFTGADRQHAGAFEQAAGGTLFLDEVGELPAALQATLLGVLERRRFRRLGGRGEIAVDVRLVSATHRELRAEVNAGTFRLDLYYRLTVVTLRTPALRERPEDVPLYVEHFLRECGHDGPIEALISPAAMQALAGHHFAGNVRELRNLIEATVAMGEPPALEVAGGAGSPPGGVVLPVVLARPYKDARAALLDEFERRYLADVLARAGGNVSAAARLACMTRSHLNELLARHKLRG